MSVWEMYGLGKPVQEEEKPKELKVETSKKKAVKSDENSKKVHKNNEKDSMKKMETPNKQ